MEKISEEVLEQKTKSIHKYLKTNLRYDQNFLPRPFMIELTGSPCVGKTTVIDNLYDSFRKFGLRIWAPQEGAARTQYIPLTEPIFNLRTGIYALAILLDENYWRNYDIIVFDRCIFDTYCWMMYWREKNLISEEEQKIFQDAFLSRFWVDKIDLAYFMICDPEIAMQREQKFSLSQKTTSTTNIPSITRLVNRYKSAYEILYPRFPQLRLMDTSHLDPQTMIQTIAIDILDTINKKIEAETNI